MKRVTFIIQAPAFDNGQYYSKSYTVARWVRNTDSIRNIAIELLRKIGEKDHDFFYPEIGQEADFAFEINLADHTKVTQNNGIKYKINPNGSLLFLEDYQPLQSDWSYGELLELQRNGYIDGDINRIMIQLPGGLGSFNDFVNIAVIVELTLSYIFGSPIMSIEKNTINPQSHIVQNWSENNLYKLSQIRSIFDEKSIWDTQEVMQRFQLTEEETTKLLEKLGYTLKGNSWRLGTTPEALHLREEWLENEKNEAERLQQEIEKRIHMM